MKAKLLMLAQVLADTAPGVVAVSGGVDSRFLSAFAWRRNMDFAAVFLDGPHLSPGERSWAVGWLARNAPDFHIIPYDPLPIAEVSISTADRCYHCKRAGFERIAALASRLDRPHVVDGGTESDLGEYRPGVRAMRELGVTSPLAFCGLTKKEIRLAAAGIDLEWPDQPSRPCLLTRFNYGLQADSRTLERLGSVEDALSALDIRAFRLRLFSADKAVLHVQKSEKELVEKEQGRIRSILQKHGFADAGIVLVGKLSGFFDSMRGARR